MKDLLWEGIFQRNLSRLAMKIKRYPEDTIYEFDTLDELREVDSVYRAQSGSDILTDVGRQIGCSEASLHDLLPLKDLSGMVRGFSFNSPKGQYEYDYEKETLQEYVK